MLSTHRHCIFLIHLLTVFPSATSHLQIYLSQIYLFYASQYWSSSQRVPQLLLEEVGLSVSVGVQTSSQEILSATCPHRDAVKGTGVLQNSLPSLLRIRSPIYGFTHLFVLRNYFVNMQSCISNTDYSTACQQSLKTLRFVKMTTIQVPHCN